MIQWRYLLLKNRYCSCSPRLVRQTTIFNNKLATRYLQDCRPNVDLDGIVWGHMRRTNMTCGLLS